MVIVTEVVCDMEKYHHSRKWIRPFVHFYGDRTIKCFKGLAPHESLIQQN